MIKIFLTGFVYLGLSFCTHTSDDTSSNKKETVQKYHPSIIWDKSSLQKVASQGAYPRMIKLMDSSTLIVYENHKGDIVYKRSLDNAKTWSNELIIHKQFVFTSTEGVKTNVKISNPEICQLKNGDLLVACNYRPELEEIAPFSIVVLRSKDNGETWSEPQILYNAAPRFKDGCWEPSFLQLNDSELQIYFANENPYQQSDEQEIAVLSSFDGGETWSEKPRTVSFRQNRRDGMPVATQVGDEIVVVIEDNKQGEFKPYIVRNKIKDNWGKPVLGDSHFREYCLSRVVPDNIYMGAPYILKLPKGEILISYQTTENRSSDWELSTMEIAIGDKTARRFDNTSRPFSIPNDKEGKWNSLALLNDSTVVALTSSNMDGNLTAPWIILGHIQYKESKIDK